MLKSWAVPKGPSMDPSQKRLAIAVEDHDLEYAGYEGIIPAGQYGAGAVVTWDAGAYEPVSWKSHEIVFTLHGTRLRGGFALVRLSRGKENEWLLLKRKDADAEPGWVIERALTAERKATLRECAPPCKAS